MAWFLARWQPGEGGAKNAASWAFAACFKEGKYTRILVYGCIWYVSGRSHSK